MGKHSNADEHTTEDYHDEVDASVSSESTSTVEEVDASVSSESTSTVDEAPPAKEPKKRWPNKFQLRRMVALAVIVVVVAVIAVVVYKKNHHIEYPDYVGTGHGAVLVEVLPGATAASLAPSLVKEDIVKSEGAFITAANNNPDIISMQPGYYQLRRQMSAEAAVAWLLDIDKRSGAVTIPDGSTLEDVRVINGKTVPGIYSRLASASCYKINDEKKCLTADEFRNAVVRTDPLKLGVPKWAVKDVNKAPNQARAIEGLIAPGLHVFDPQATPVEIIKSLITESMAIFNDAGINAAAKERHLTRYEVIVMASLLQREVAPADYEKVARVIINRMRKGIPLQFDSTVNYVQSEQEVATTDAARQTDTPWNTYINQGLPITPICSPSPDAIKALIDPVKGPWLYFVTVDQKGTTKFNATIEEHERDVERARKNGVFDRQKKD